MTPCGIAVQRTAGRDTYILSVSGRPARLACPASGTPASDLRTYLPIEQGRCVLSRTAAQHSLVHSDGALGYRTLEYSGERRSCPWVLGLPARHRQVTRP